MSYGIFDSYSYSRPVSYVSVNPRVTRQEVLVENDFDSQEVQKFFEFYKLPVQNRGGLSRGFVWGDIEVGKRVYNHNAVSSQYYIRQWKPTNDLGNHHPTGTHFITRSLQSLIGELDKVVKNSQKTYK